MQDMADIEGYDVRVDGGTGSRSSSFEEVFDLFYDPLQEFIDSPVHERARDQHSVNTISRERYQDPVRAFERDWYERLASIDAQLEVDYGHTSVTYDLEPRTDVEPELTHVVPSTVTATRDGHEELVVREWRRYDEDILTDMHNHARAFKRNSHDDYVYRSILDGRADPEQFEGSMVLVPELDLEIALHAEDGVYESMPEEGQPVTPYDVRVAEFTEDSAFVLRDYLPNEFVDRKEGLPERFGQFYGTMQEMGLVSCFDREDEFARERSRFGEYTVFHDPEFVAYTENDNWFGMDWKDLRERTLSGMSADIVGRIEEERHRADPGPPVDLLDSLYGRPEPEIFPSWKVL